MKKNNNFAILLISVINMNASVVVFYIVLFSLILSVGVEAISKIIATRE